jgi:hypothetical protein
LKKIALILATAAVLASSLTLATLAENPATVNATVTVLNISVSVSPSTVAYGSRPLSATGVVPSPDNFLATNNGNVTEKFSIKGAGTAAWTLGSTPGADRYVHRFSSSSQGPWTELTETNSIFASSIAPAGNVQVFLQMDLPTSTTATAQQTAPVTILATQ